MLNNSEMDYVAVMRHRAKQELKKKDLPAEILCCLSRALNKCIKRACKECPFLTEDLLIWESPYADDEEVDAQKQ